MSHRGDLIPPEGEWREEEEEGHIRFYRSLHCYVRRVLVILLLSRNF